MSITLRQYQPTDRQVMVSLMGTFDQYIQSIDDKRRTDYKEGSPEYFTDKMVRLSQSKQGVIYLACDDGNVIGFVSGYVDEQDEDEKMETIPAIPGIVGELFVSSEYRGKKIGKQLLEKIESYLKKKGCTIVRFPVFAPNTLARNFYEKAGYRERLIYIMKELVKSQV